METLEQQFRSTRAARRGREPVPRRALQVAVEDYALDDSEDYGAAIGR